MMHYYTNEEIREGIGKEKIHAVLSKCSYDLEVSGRNALENYILLTESGHFENEVKRFYSRYFWFLTFCEEFKSENGQNAGLDQQLFQIIEQAKPSIMSDVDWDILKSIEEEIKSPPWNGIN